MNTIFNDFKILQLVKANWPEYDWLEETQIGEADEFLIDLESLQELEEENGPTMKIFNLNVPPEIEINFESEEEMHVQAYTDRQGNLRCMYLNID